MKETAKRKKDAERRRKWYNSISEEKRNQLRANMRKYFQDNKETLIAKQKDRRHKARLRKATHQFDSTTGDRGGSAGDGVRGREVRQE